MWSTLVISALTILVSVDASAENLHQRHRDAGNRNWNCSYLAGDAQVRLEVLNEWRRFRETCFRCEAAGQDFFKLTDTTGKCVTRTGSPSAPRPGSGGNPISAQAPRPSGSGGSSGAQALGVMSGIIGLALQQQGRDGQQQAAQAEAQLRALEQEDALRRAREAEENRQRIAAARNPFDTSTPSGRQGNPFDPPAHRLDRNRVVPTTVEAQLQSPVADGSSTEAANPCDTGGRPYAGNFSISADCIRPNNRTGAETAGGRNRIDNLDDVPNPFRDRVEIRVEATQSPIQPFGHVPGPAAAGATIAQGGTGPIAARVPGAAADPPSREPTQGGGGIPYKARTLQREFGLAWNCDYITLPRPGYPSANFIESCKKCERLGREADELRPVQANHEGSLICGGLLRPGQSISGNSTVHLKPVDTRLPAIPGATAR